MGGITTVGIAERLFFSGFSCGRAPVPTDAVGRRTTAVAAFSYRNVTILFRRRRAFLMRQVGLVPCPAVVLLMPFAQPFSRAVTVAVANAQLFIYGQTTDDAEDVDISF